MTRRIVFSLGVLLLFWSTAQAQVKVDLRISRRLFLLYEPIFATVAVTNNTGRDITLRNSDMDKWFGFQVVTGEERLVPPRNPNYALEPLQVRAGETLKRSVNLPTLYPVTDFGLYRIKATIYFADMDKFFTSAPASIEITEGKKIWEQTVGVPEDLPGAGGDRTISLLTHRLPKENMLYYRVEDRNAGVVYATYPVGPVLLAMEPQVELDAQNEIHILQLVGPKTYLYSRFGINGEFHGKTPYHEVTTRPRLRRTANGTVGISGGEMDVRIAQPANAPASPKLSDRPAGLPKR